MAFPRVQFPNFFLREYAPRAFGADSPLVSPVTLVLNVELQKNPYLNKTKDDTEKQWSRNLRNSGYENRRLETKKNYTKRD